MGNFWIKELIHARTLVQRLTPSRTVILTPVSSVQKGVMGVQQDQYARPAKQDFMKMRQETPVFLASQIQGFTWMVQSVNSALQSVRHVRALDYLAVHHALIASTSMKIKPAKKIVQMIVSKLRTFLGVSNVMDLVQPKLAL